FCKIVCRSMHHSYALDGNFQGVGGNLRHDRFHALPDCRRADIKRDIAALLDFNSGGLARSRGAALDEARNAQAVIASVHELSNELGLFPPPAFLDAAIEGAEVVAAVAGGIVEAVERTHRRERIRHRACWNEIAPSDLESVDLELVRSDVEHPFEEKAA